MSGCHPNINPQPSTLVEIIRWRALHQPNQLACTYLSHGEAKDRSLTYAELDQEARAISAVLQHQAPKGARALLLYPPGIGFATAFFGCLYAGIIAVPAYPPQVSRLERTLPRIRAIMNNAQPSVALTTSAVLSGLETILEQAPDFKNMYWLATDAVPEAMAQEWQEPALNGDTLAFLQYSSGSTGTPKGVMVAHSNLLHNMAFLHRRNEHTAESHMVSWLPLFHDMGLIGGGLLQPLYSGFPLTLLSPASFLQRPMRWLETISQTRATVSGGPNFAYDLCVRRTTEEQRATLDLSNWGVAFNGAEPVRHDTLERFIQAFEPCGFRREAFYPCYGLAEATLFVTGGAKADPPIYQAVAEDALMRNQVVPIAPEQQQGRILVSSGKVWPELQVVIVDPDTRIQSPSGQVGEIWAAGPSIAQGYWNQPEETRATFQAHLADTGEGPFLRTGDLGFLQGQDLFVTGRRKDLIIIRGQNHYPQDIELTVEQSHPAVRPGCCAAFAYDSGAKEQLVIVAEVDHRYQAKQEQTGTTEHSRLDSQAVIKAIRQMVSEHHELQVHDVVLIKPGHIPKTSSGKIQRHACRAGFLAGSLSKWSE